MLVIEVELLHRTYRADPDGSAFAGRATVGEWPPAPLRVLAALVAADGTGDRRRHTDGSELAVLEAAPPPRIRAAADSDTHHQPLVPRYVVEHSGSAATGKTHQEYPARLGTQVRPGVRVCPKHPTASYLWELDAELDVVEALAMRAARVGYLGCADSPVRMTVRTELPDGPGEWFEPDASGRRAIGAPAPGVLAAMDAHHDAWTAQGASVARAQFPGLRRLAWYRPPGVEPPAEDAGGSAQCLWFMLGAPLPGRRVLAVTEAWRASVLDRYQRIVGEPPPVLLGHGFRGRGYDTARFLALPDVGSPRSRGRLHGLALWFPPDTDAAVVDGCRSALRSMTELVGRGFTSPVAPWSGERRPWAASPSRWQGPSRWWSTAVPAVYERRVRRLDQAEVTRWCEHAGYPSPALVRVSRGRLLPGAVQLAPSEARRAGRDAKPYTHLEVVFDEPVQGPVVLGGARQWGLGLCAPVGEHDA